MPLQKCYLQVEADYSSVESRFKSKIISQPFENSGSLPEIPLEVALLVEEKTSSELSDICHEGKQMLQNYDGSTQSNLPKFYIVTKRNIARCNSCNKKIALGALCNA